MSYDVGITAPNTAGPATNRSVLFGADNQGAATPVPYDFGALRTAVQGILYGASRWYLPFGVSGGNTGSAPGINSIRLFPGFVPQKCTLSALGCNISTLHAGGSVQLAVYANSSVMRPTGNALASTASITTASTGAVNAAVSVQLDVGWYWFASNTNDATVALNNISASLAPGIIGAASQGNNLFSGVGMGLTIAQTFGTWPDLTSGSFTEGFGSIPAVQYQVTSVP